MSITQTKFGYIDTCITPVPFLTCNSSITKVLYISEYRIKTINNLSRMINNDLILNQTKYNLYYTFGDSDINCTFFDKNFNNLSDLFTTYNNIKNTSLTLYYDVINNNTCSQTIKYTNLFPFGSLILIICALVYAYIIFIIYKYSAKYRNYDFFHVQKYDVLTIIISGLMTLLIIFANLLLLGMYK